MRSTAAISSLGPERIDRHALPPARLDTAIWTADRESPTGIEVLIVGG